MMVTKGRKERTAREIFEFIAGYVSENGWAPSYREIVDATSISSTSSVMDYLRRLESCGFIKFGSVSRAIAVTEEGWNEIEGKGRA